MTEHRIYGSDVVVDLLRRLGIEYVACNPGATFRGLHDSLVNFGGNRRPELIECCHEEISVAIAHGYAKAKGRPMAAALHNIVGLLHGSMAVFNAWCDQVPVLLLGGTGPMDLTRRRPWIDWIHTAQLQGNLVREFVKWDYQPHNLAGVPEALLRAYRQAVTPPCGPVYLCLDTEIQEGELAGAMPELPAQAFTLPRPPQADGAALQEAARWLVEARRPVLLADLAGRSETGFQALVELAELLAAPLLDLGERSRSLNFPSGHPLNLSGAEEEVLAEADLVLALEVGDLHGALHKVEGRSGQARRLTAPQTRLIHISLQDMQRHSWAETYQRFQPVDLTITADAGASLPALLEVSRSLLPEGGRDERRARRQALAARHHELRQGWAARADAEREARPISPAWLAAELGALLRGKDWVLANGSLKGWARRLWDFTCPRQWLGTSGGAGLGYGLGASLGAVLAHRDSGKIIVDLQADGDFLFTPAALWTAAHHRLPLLVVMYNNRAYHNSVEHQTRVARQRGRDLAAAGVGTRLDEPPVDFAALARSLGVYGEGPLEEPAQLRPALQRALREVEAGRPALVDVITAAR